MAAQQKNTNTQQNTHSYLERSSQFLLGGPLLQLTVKHSLTGQPKLTLYIIFCIVPIDSALLNFIQTCDLLFIYKLLKYNSQSLKR